MVSTWIGWNNSHGLLSVLGLLSFSPEMWTGELFLCFICDANVDVADIIDINCSGVGLILVLSLSPKNLFDFILPPASELVQVFSLLNIASLIP